jgi:hypothetical protein
LPRKPKKSKSVDQFKLLGFKIPTIYRTIKRFEKQEKVERKIGSGKKCALYAPIRPADFLPLSRVRLLEDWQSDWDGSDMGRYAYSVWPVVSFMPWFKRFDGDRVIISMINRMMANHSCLRSHLGRIGIVESSMYVCFVETIDQNRPCIVGLREI